MTFPLGFLSGSAVERAAGRAIRFIAYSLKKSRCAEAADFTLRLGLSRYPDNFELLKLNALFSSIAGRHAEAFERWDLVRQRHPEHAPAWFQSAASARVLSRVDEASALMREALDRFPDDFGVVREAARTADRRRAYAESILLWDRLRSRSGKDWEAAHGHANCLVQLHRFDEAEVAIDHASGSFQNARSFLALKGALAMAREDWDAALSIWTAFREKYPNDQVGWENLGRTLTSKHLDDVDRRENGQGITGPVDIVKVEDDVNRTLLLTFESVGGDCEFGMVQRRYGAEPLGLLRWNYVTFASLMAAVAVQFEGMGDLDQTELWSGGVDEYFVQDKRWGLAMHTFLSSTQVDKEVFLPKMARRIGYLRDKLVAEIQRGEKTIVFKSDSVSQADMKALQAALWKIGPVDLLWVRTKSEGSPVPRGKAGEVFKIQDNLYVGLLDRLGATQGYWDIAYDDWISICRNMRQAPTLA